jgi:L-fucose isomerase-like protein
MNFTTIYYLGPEMTVCGYLNDYKLTPGQITLESWIADVLIKHGYGLAVKPGVEMNERKNRKCNRKVRACHKEILQKRGD